MIRRPLSAAPAAILSAMVTEDAPHAPNAISPTPYNTQHRKNGRGRRYAVHCQHWTRRNCRKDFVGSFVTHACRTHALSHLADWAPRWLRSAAAAAGEQLGL